MLVPFMLRCALLGTLAPLLHARATYAGTLQIFVESPWMWYQRALCTRVRGTLNRSYMHNVSL